jgi:hypothetical protein
MELKRSNQGIENDIHFTIYRDLLRDEMDVDTDYPSSSSLAIPTPQPPLTPPNQDESLSPQRIATPIPMPISVPAPSSRIAAAAAIGRFPPLVQDPDAIFTPPRTALQSRQFNSVPSPLTASRAAQKTPTNSPLVSRMHLTNATSPVTLSSPFSKDNRVPLVAAMTVQQQAYDDGTSMPSKTTTTSSKVPMVSFAGTEIVQNSNIPELSPHTPQPLPRTTLRSPFSEPKHLISVPQISLLPQLSSSPQSSPLRSRSPSPNPVHNSSTIQSPTTSKPPHQGRVVISNVVTTSAASSTLSPSIPSPARPTTPLANVNSPLTRSMVFYSGQQVHTSSQQQPHGKEIAEEMEDIFDDLIAYDAPHTSSKPAKASQDEHSAKKIQQSPQLLPRVATFSPHISASGTATPQAPKNSVTLTSANAQSTVSLVALIFYSPFFFSLNTQTDVRTTYCSNAYVLQPGSTLESDSEEVSESELNTSTMSESRGGHRRMWKDSEVKIIDSLENFIIVFVR